MRAFNYIIICGHLGRDPELRYTPNGNPVCNLSLATTEKWNDQETTTWFRVTVWGKQAELCNEYLRKGSEAYVAGTLKQSEYTDRDGNKRYNLEVTARDVHFLGRKGDSGGEERGEANNVTQISDHAGRREALRGDEGIVDDGDIPF